MDGSCLIICNKPCFENNYKTIDREVEGFKLNTKKWFTPLIGGSYFVEDIVQSPTNAIWAVDPSKLMNIAYISRIQDVLDKQFKLKINPTPKINYFSNVTNTKESYSNIEDYVNIFLPLVQIEENYEKSKYESEQLYTSYVDFYQLNNNTIALFGIISTKNITLKYADKVVMELTAKKMSKAVELTGMIIKLDSENTHVLLDKYVECPEKGYYLIKFIWNNTTFVLIKRGLNLLVNGGSVLNSSIESAILGKPWVKQGYKMYSDSEIPDNLNVEGLPDLNLSQRTCIKKALQTPLFLIQGPPGTGKTFTISALIYHLVKLKNERFKKLLENINKSEVNTSLNLNVTNDNKANKDNKNNIENKENINSIGKKKKNKNKKALQQVELVTSVKQEESPTNSKKKSKKDKKDKKTKQDKLVNITNITNNTNNTIVNPNTQDTKSKSELLEEEEKLRKILVCAPSNVAADNIAEKLNFLGLNVVRVFSQMKESLNSRVQTLGLGEKIKGLTDRKYGILIDILDCKDSGEKIESTCKEIYKEAIQ